MMKCVVEQPSTLQSLAIERMGDWVASQAVRIVSSVAELQHDAAREVLSRHVDAVRTRLEYRLPRMWHDAVAVEAIRALDKLKDAEQFSTLGVCESDRMKIFGRMIETVFTSHLTRLTLDYRKMYNMTIFLPTLLTKSHLIRDLVELELIVSETIDISQLLKDLHNLKCLTLGLFLYTANVVKCIADNCKSIEVLQFISETTDEEKEAFLPYEKVRPLTRLPNLKRIKICGFVGSKTIQALLLSCKQLEYVDIVRYYDSKHYSSGYEYYEPTNDEIASALQVITSKQSMTGNLKLKSYKNYEKTTLEQLKLIVQMCPLIEDVILTNFYRRTTAIPLETVANILKDLPNLRKLELNDYYFGDSNVAVVFKTIRGCNLTELRLCNVHDLNLIAVMFVSQTCPNLECLYILSYINTYGYTRSEYNDMIAVLEIPPFKNLKRLTFYGWSNEGLIDATRQLAFFMLSNCVNVEFFTVATNLLNDDNMSEILDENPLIYLKELRIEVVLPKWVHAGKEELSTFVIDRIIENCVGPLVVLVEQNECDSEESE